MIGTPFINVRCDARVTGREQCREAVVFSLPAFVADAEQCARLFLAMNQEWAVQGKVVFCPDCRRAAINARASAAAGRVQG